MKVATILGTRPEIIKLSALLPLLDASCTHILIHTGQHYDYQMDAVFFDELHLRKPAYMLDIGSHEQGKQTGMMLWKIEEVLLKERPDMVIVQGDTNSTLSGALAAAKLNIPLLHLEAGCRSFNREMPEEINRVIADHLAHFLIAPDEQSVINLRNEGISSEKIFLLGSTLFDAVLRNRDFLQVDAVLKEFGLQKDAFVLTTIHRAETTRKSEMLRGIVQALNEISKDATMVFPLHPRTKKVLDEQGITLDERIKVIEPQSYFRFLALLSAATLCLTDSGGIQEEAVVFNTPCLILRNETEWVRFTRAGKNILLGTSPEQISRRTIDLLHNREEINRLRGIIYPYEQGVVENVLALLNKWKQ